MKVAVVGSGGREHALATVLGRTADVVVAPGNPGMVSAGVDCTPAPPEELDVDLVVIGPEAPLVDGLADRLRAAGRLVYGPGADGAHLEGSKGWMKEVVAAAGVPTAAYGTFTDVEQALAFLRTMPSPWVVKTDGLAAGKGVLVTGSLIEAEDDVKAKLAGASFGEAGRTVIIEEGMTGPELSVLAVCDGTRAVALAPSQDFKRVRDGDSGPNTGGMGAYSPVPSVPASLLGDVLDRFIEPTLAELRRRGIDYRGTLYAGLMLTPDGPKLVEYNVRFGDPEAQVVLPRVGTDLTELLAAAAAGDLTSAAELTVVDEAAVLVVLAAEGYPSTPRIGDPINGLDDVKAMEGVTVFHAAVGELEGRLVTAGGRVLNVVGTGADLATARTRAYDAVERISWLGMHHRSDIAREAARS
ncbi:MAG TPA: phosphoribosylamine--glycine ligase [Acidimicrobiales bacterium]|nr:phosphoribosylamine--glycine ligase [Acidimicrobiales bacterium]